MGSKQWGNYSANKVTYPTAFKTFAQIIVSTTSQSNVYGASPHVAQPIYVFLTSATFSSYYLTQQQANQWAGVSSSGRFIAMGC